MPLDALMSAVMVGWLVLAVALVFAVSRACRRISSAVRAAPKRLGLERRVLGLRAEVAPPGSLRQVFQLRASLHDNLTHTERMLAERGGGAPVVGELLDELRASADDLHRQLRIAQYEPAEDYRREILSRLSTRVQQFNNNALSLRRSGMELHRDPSLRQIQDQELRDRIDGLAAAVQDLKINGSRLG